MAYIVVMDDTSQRPMGWLNAAASLNIYPMSVTLPVSQCPIGWLKTPFL